MQFKSETENLFSLFTEMNQFSQIYIIHLLVYFPLLLQINK